VFFWQDEEAKELSKIMMSKKTKRLYGRMQHGINAKREVVSRLLVKRGESLRFEEGEKTKRLKLE
jgi:hypothetical protein